MEIDKKEISVSECKKHFLGLVDEVKTNKSSFIITKRNKPVAEIRPLTPKSNKSYFGFLKGQIIFNDDIVNCNFADEWDLNK